MVATVWQMPDGFDSSMMDDNAANAPSLERLTDLRSKDDEDTKRSVVSSDQSPATFDEFLKMLFFTFQFLFTVSSCSSNRRMSK